MIWALFLTTSALLPLALAQSQSPSYIQSQDAPAQGLPSYNVPFQQQPQAGGSYFPAQLQQAAPLSGVGVMPQQGASPFNWFQPQQPQGQMNPYNPFLSLQQQIPPNFNPFASIPQQNSLGVPFGQYNFNPFQPQQGLNQPLNPDNQDPNQNPNVPQAPQPNSPILNTNPFNNPGQQQQDIQPPSLPLVQLPTPQQPMAQPPSELAAPEPAQPPVQPTQSAHTGLVKRDDDPSSTDSDSTPSPSPFLTKAWIQARPDISPGALNSNASITSMFAFVKPTSLPNITGSGLPIPIPEMPPNAIPIEAGPLD